MVNTQIYCDYSNTAVFLPRRTICFWGTMSIVENNLLKLSVYWWHIRLNILKTFSCSEEITSVLVSTESTVSMMNVRLVFVHFSLLFLYFDALNLKCWTNLQVNEGSTLNYGKRSPTASTAYQLLPSSTRRSSAVTEVSHPIYSPWNRSDASWGPQTYRIRVKYCLKSINCLS